MDIIDHLRALSEKASRIKDQIQTEEATKNALVLPFLHALGYDVFNPFEVVPEFTADLGIKKGEKVDFCIQKDGQPIIIMECKWWGADLNVHDSQLHRYFHVTKARFGILTNGINYRFYTDLENQNKMDDKPFFEFSLLDLKENIIPEIKKFHKSTFNVADILNTANELKYAKEIRGVLNAQLSNPSEEFVKFFVGHIYKGPKTAKVIDQFTPIVKKSLNQFISDLISDRLKVALDNEIKSNTKEQEALTQAIEDVKEKKVETTEEEKEAFYIIKSILRDSIKPNRIFSRDNQTYFAVILDDSIRKQVCRLYLNGTKKCIAFIEEGGKESKYPINTIEDIYLHAIQIKAVASKFIEKTLV